MPPDPVHTVTLTCHPETPTDAVRGIAARVCRKSGGKLAVTYVLEGELDRLRVPAPRAPRAVALAPQVAVRGVASKLELDAVIRLDRLSAPYLGAPLSLALSAVIEDSDGVLSYWALRHPPGKPDFHHSEAFALDLARADR